MKLRTVVIVSFIAVIVIGLAGYYGFSNSAPQPPAVQAPQTVAVTKCDIQQTVEAPGQLNNTSGAQVLMPVTGRLAQVLVRAGDSVAAGQVLAALDD